MIKSTILEVYPGAGFAVQNITHLVKDFVVTTGVRQGTLVVFYKHSTGSLIIGEHESGVIADIEQALETIAPTDNQYHHHLREVDFNGYAHVRAAIMPTSLAIPIIDGELALGTHQEIQVVDSQPEELPRFVVLQVTGEQ
jgi:secondary thiamine-phosphate synthase enzyme